MKIAIVYDSSTGTTAKAAEAMGNMLVQQGHQCRVQSVKDANPALVKASDRIFVGSWIKGLFIIRQHPTAGSIAFIDQLGNLSGKKTAVFCTYKLAVGSSLRKMAEALERNGAQVDGMFKFRGPEPNSKFEAFAASLKR